MRRVFGLLKPGATFGQGETMMTFHSRIFGWLGVGVAMGALGFLFASPAHAVAFVPGSSPDDIIDVPGSQISSQQQTGQRFDNMSFNIYNRISWFSGGGGGQQTSSRLKFSTIFRRPDRTFLRRGVERQLYRKHRHRSWRADQCSWNLADQRAGRIHIYTG